MALSNLSNEQLEEFCSLVETGSKHVKQGKGTLFLFKDNELAACALGAAYIALKNPSEELLYSIAKDISLGEPIYTMFNKRYAAANDKSKLFCDYIYHLNDARKMTFEQIVNFLRAEFIIKETDDVEA